MFESMANFQFFCKKVLTKWSVLVHKTGVLSTIYSGLLHGNDELSSFFRFLVGRFYTKDVLSVWTNLSKHL